MATGNTSLLEVSRFKGSEMDQVSSVMEVPSITVTNPIRIGVTGFFLKQTTEIHGCCLTMFHLTIQEE